MVNGVLVKWSLVCLTTLGVTGLFNRAVAAPSFPPLACDGASISLSLKEGVDGKFSVADLKTLPYFKAGVSKPLSAGKIAPQLRLDVCVQEEVGKFELQRVIVNFGFMTVAQELLASKGQLQNVLGLKEALFGQAAMLSLDLVVDEDTQYLVRGTPKNLVGLVQLYKSGTGKWQLSASDILLGELQEGDPFANLKCELGKSEVHSNFQLGTAKFEVGMCIFMGGGETTGYELFSMSVSDGNPQLPPGLQGKIWNFEGANLKEALNYRWNHHNACDSFVLKVSELNSSYAATSAPMAGCGTIVPGAPERTYEDQDHRTKYVIRYGAKTETGFLEKGHYLRLY